MTYQEKLQWLGRYQEALSYQHMLEDEIQALRSDAVRVTTCMTGMPGRGAPNVDRLPQAVERIEKAQKRLAQQLDACMEMRMRVTDSIMALGDAAQQEVLRRRYVMGQSYHEIAQSMGVVQRRVYQLHTAGVERLEPEI